MCYNLQWDIFNRWRWMVYMSVDLDVHFYNFLGQKKQNKNKTRLSWGDLCHTLKRHWPLLHAELYYTRPTPRRWGSSGCLGTCSLNFAAAEARSLIFYLLQQQTCHPVHGRVNLQRFHSPWRSHLVNKETQFKISNSNSSPVSLMASNALILYR